MSPLAPLAAPLSLSNSPLGGGAADPNHLNADGPSFGDTLQNAFGQVNTLQNQAADMAQDFAAGKSSDVHGVMIASEQATLALQLTTQVRNKAVEAYQEVMRITM